MNLGERIRSGVKWLVFGKVGNRLFELGFGVILARVLVPADFGMIATIGVFTGFVGMFTSGGMGQSLIRAKVADVDDFTAVFTLQLGLGILAYLGFYFAAPWIAHFFNDPLYTDLIRVSALSFLLRPLLVMRNAWLTRQMSFKSRTLVEVATGLAAGFLATTMAVIGFGVWSLVLSGLLASILRNFLLARITRLALHLNVDVSVMRKHSGYGAKIVASDFVSHLRSESKTLIISKLAGPAFLGLFNKAESLSRLPNQLLMSPTMEPLFRALSQIQDDIEQSRYMFFRTITLLMAYTTPIYVILWWIATPFIRVVYGEQWLDAGPPMSILVAAGVFLNVVFPCGVVLAAQNRLAQEIFAKSINLGFVVAACVLGLNWGLEGVAWGILISHALLAVHFYWLVSRILHAGLRELVLAVIPGLSLSAGLLAVLALTDLTLTAGLNETPWLYVAVMIVFGCLAYAAAFLFVPIPALGTEAERWRDKLRAGLAFVRQRNPL